MPMFNWRVDFDYQLEGSEDWSRDVVHHLGGENGGEAVNFVREKLIGNRQSTIGNHQSLPCTLGKSGVLSKHAESPLLSRISRSISKPV